MPERQHRQESRLAKLSQMTIMFWIVNICILIGFIEFGVQPAAAANPDNEKIQAFASILIKATPSIVWKAIHAERNSDPDIAYSKVLESAGSTVVLEQKFLHVPLLGTVTAVTRQTERLEQRIDYKLMRSDKFKALEGSWELTPVNGGSNTMLQLRSRLDIGVPFSSMFVKAAAKRKLERRISNVKTLAEKEQSNTTGY